MRTGRRLSGWTLIELLLGLAMLGVLAALVLPAYGDAREKARVAEAIADIRVIESLIASHRLAHRALPGSLEEVAWTDPDPWGNPYAYVPLVGLRWVGRARVDRFQVPINSDYDLYSKGRDGLSVLLLQAPPSWDDVVRASDGAFVGLAHRY